MKIPQFFQPKKCHILDFFGAQPCDTGPHMGLPGTTCVPRGTRGHALSSCDAPDQT